MVSERPILDLPQELIVRVASFLTTIELGYFRRSCKDIERYLFRSFAEEFFTKRQFMLEHESLNALLGIAHHTSLASSLQEVIFDIRTLAPERSEPRLRMMEARNLNGCLPVAQLLYTGKVLAMLIEVFSTLPRLRTVGIRDFSGVGRWRESTGWNLWRSGDWNPWGWSIGGGRRGEVLQITYITGDILPLILTALAESRKRPEKLEVLLRGRFALGRDAFIIQDDPKILAVLNNLKTVMLNIGPKIGEEAHHSDAPIDPEISATTLALYFSPVIRFLHHLDAVEHLRLNFFSELSFGTNVLEWLAGKQLDIGSEPWTAVRFERLTTLEIGSIIISYEILIKILIRFRLKSFALWRLNLGPNPNPKSNEVYYEEDNLWPVFLRELADQLPRPSAINKIMIGHAGQRLERRRDDMTVGEIANILWYTTPARSDDGLSNKMIEYDKQKSSSQNVHGWLVAAALLTDMRPQEFSEEDNESLEFDDDDDDEDDEDIFGEGFGDGLVDTEWLHQIAAIGH